MRDGSGWASTKFRTAKPMYSMTGTPGRNAADTSVVRPKHRHGVDGLPPGRRMSMLVKSARCADRAWIK